MNKSELVDVLTEKLGDRRTAAAALDGVLETIVDAVRSGGSVSLTGFGVFEARPRAARVGRNPRTGEPVTIPATTVPAFRPGAGFRTAVGGSSAPAPRPARRAIAAASAPAPTVAADALVKEPKAKAGASFAEKTGKNGKAEKIKPAKDKAAKDKADKPKKGKSKK